MFDLFKKKKKFNNPVEITNLVKNGAQFNIFFSDDSYLNYEILQYCASWNERFSGFKFFLPQYSSGFFGHIRTFANAEFLELRSDQRLEDRSIILNLSSDPVIRSSFARSSASLIIDMSNQGNLQFVPDISEARDLFNQFCSFFQLKKEKKSLDFEFTQKEIRSTGHHFFQNKFLNFLLDTKNIDQNILKDIIISIKQNFPSNLYLSGQNLKKHEFINLKNLTEMTLLEKFLLSSNCDLLISDDLEAVKIFRDLDLKQIYIAEENYLDSVPSVNSMNLHVIREAIASILEK